MGCRIGKKRQLSFVLLLFISDIEKRHTFPIRNFMFCEKRFSVVGGRAQRLVFFGTVELFRTSHNSTFVCAVWVNQKGTVNKFNWRKKLTLLTYHFYFSFVQAGNWNYWLSRFFFRCCYLRFVAAPLDAFLSLMGVGWDNSTVEILFDSINWKV